MEAMYDTVPEIIVQDPYEVSIDYEAFAQVEMKGAAPRRMKRSYSDAGFDTVPCLSPKRAYVEDDAASDCSGDSALVEVSYYPHVSNGPHSMSCASRANVDLLFSLFDVLEEGAPQNTGAVPAQGHMFSSFLEVNESDDDLSPFVSDYESDLGFDFGDHQQGYEHTFMAYPTAPLMMS